MGVVAVGADGHGQKALFDQAHPVNAARIIRKDVALGIPIFVLRRELAVAVPAKLGDIRPVGFILLVFRR